MVPEFARTKPLQAAKLAAIIVVVPVAFGVIYGVVPHDGTASLFLVPLLSIGLALAVFAEAVVAGYRYLRAGGLRLDRSALGSVYLFVRLGELVAVIASGVTFALILRMIHEGPMAGPGAIGLWMILVGLSLVVIVGSLVRTLTEYYYVRTGRFA